MYNINFINQNIIYKTPGGILSDICRDAGFPIELICGGQGTCSKCKAKIRRDDSIEVVLACRELITSDIDIWLNDEQISRAATILENDFISYQIPFHPSVSKDPHMIDSESSSEITYVRYDGQIIDIEHGDTSSKLYGIAIDIGTTSVILYAYDLTDGHLVDIKSSLNSQISYGADVISRISYAIQSRDNLTRLHVDIIDTINKLIDEIDDKISDFSKNIYHAIICGNSAMQHLFLNLDPSGLAISPFTNIISNSVRLSGNRSDLHINPHGMIEFLPLLGGFVGADTTCVLLALPDNKDSILMIDLGTNSEIAIGRSGIYKVASTACGPALEGGNISCGMRAATGAIEKISIDNDGSLSLKVIDDADPIGLCGSAIIDAISILLRYGIIDKSGHMLTYDEYKLQYPDSPLLSHIKDIDKYNPAFYFANKVKPIYISQQDVRQIQLAKSAIYSGCMALLDEYDLSLDDISTIYLSGAFGNYIDIDNALYIGLLPKVHRDRIISIGNGAGLGASMCLINREKLIASYHIKEHIDHIELATNDKFVDEYIINMNF